MIERRIVAFFVFIYAASLLIFGVLWFIGIINIIPTILMLIGAIIILPLVFKFYILDKK